VGILNISKYFVFFCHFERQSVALALNHSFYLSFAEIEESGEKNKWDRFAAEKSKIFLSSLFFKSVALALNHPFYISFAYIEEKK
jgi:hypothetical protein